MFLLFVGFLLNGKTMAQSVYVGENETVSLSVPNVSPGYVDKAIWACSNSTIAFVDKSTTSATIKAVKSFDEYATVELLYVQKYVDAKGFTRAITYTKNFYVRYKHSGNGSFPKKAGFYPYKTWISPHKTPFFVLVIFMANRKGLLRYWKTLMTLNDLNDLNDLIR